ncbi:MAG: triose-phosphate isomerase [Candidatus Aenigmarchaeota archaeon]|nr:triose-phosphate isomerase [Candidatus Aenigmarchaeota archaeon]
MKPFILINFKTYKEGTGASAERLATLINKISKKYDANIFSAVQTADVHRIASLGIPIFCQHVDPVGFGSKTGYVLPECIKENGAIGTLINHSEKRIDLKSIPATIERCKSIGLKTIVCVQNIIEAKSIIKYEPDYLSLEDKDLIGSGISITHTMPDVVKKFSELFKDSRTLPLCGAGVSNGKDVRTAMQLGMRGVLLASAVLKAKDPESVLKELVSED